MRPFEETLLCCKCDGSTLWQRNGLISIECYKSITIILGRVDNILYSVAG